MMLQSYRNNTSKAAQMKHKDIEHEILYCPFTIYFESRLGATFSAPVQTGDGAHPASYTRRTGSLPRAKRPGRDVNHPPSSSAEVKEKAELYFPSLLCLHRKSYGELYFYHYCVLININLIVI